MSEMKSVFDLIDFSNLRTGLSLSWNHVRKEFNRIDQE
jgi:hypothetical protein